MNYFCLSLGYNTVSSPTFLLIFREAFNELLPDATHCVFLRIYYGTHWTDDLVRSTRALLKEAHEAGWHVWLIHQVHKVLWKRYDL